MNEHWNRASAAGALLLTLMSSPARAWAEASPLPEPLTPDVVVAYARAHRAEIRSAHARAAAAAEVPKVVGAPADPMIMTSLDHLPFSGMGANVSLMIQEEFPMSGVLADRRRAAAAEARASAADAQVVSLDIEEQALSAYLMVAEIERMKRILEGQKAVAEEVASATEVELQVAQATASDVLRASLEVARAEGERAALESDLAAASAMLDASLGLPASPRPHSCRFSVPDRDPPPLADLLATAKRKRPELTASKERITKARAEVDVMSSMYRPMGLARVGAAYTMSDRAGLMLGVGISIPIFRSKLDAGRAEARSMVAAVSADDSATQIEIEAEVAAARAEILASRTRYDSLREKVVPLAESAVSATLASYGAGQVPLVSVLDAVRALREAKMAEVVAEIRAGLAWARLGRAVGVVTLDVR